MISFDKAKASAEEFVAGLASASGVEFALYADETIEVNEGWVFFYNSKEFIETGDFASALAGNGPIFVDRSGNLRSLPSGMNWEDALRGV
jgi:hypothetical protein